MNLYGMMGNTVLRVVATQEVTWAVSVKLACGAGVRLALARRAMLVREGF